MKYLWCGLALLLVLGLACGLTTWRVAELTGRTAALLEQARRAALSEDYAAAGEAAELAQRFWQRHEGFWGTVLHHTETDELAFRFSELAYYAQEEERTEFLSRTAELLAMLEHLARMEKPYYFNIL